MNAVRLQRLSGGNPVECRIEADGSGGFNEHNGPAGVSNKRRWKMRNHPQPLVGDDPDAYLQRLLGEKVKEGYHVVDSEGPVNLVSISLIADKAFDDAFVDRIAGVFNAQVHQADRQRRYRFGSIELVRMDAWERVKASFTATVSAKDAAMCLAFLIPLGKEGTLSASTANGIALDPRQCVLQATFHEAIEQFLRDEGVLPKPINFGNLRGTTGKRNALSVSL